MPSGFALRVLYCPDKRAHRLREPKLRLRNQLKFGQKSKSPFTHRFIVDKGGLLTASDKHGWSVLQYAVRYASLETVEALIELGADIFHR